MNTLARPDCQRPTNRFRSRSALVSAGAFAAAATAAAPSLARAQIIWSGTLDQVVNSETPLALLDFNGNSIADAPEARLSYFLDIDKTTTHVISLTGVTGTKTDPDVAFLYQSAPVSFGATIDSSLSYSGENSYNHIPADNISHYRAFKYQAEGGPFYGWVEITRTSEMSATLHQWAYNSESGEPITAGIVPEPSGLFLLSFSAAILACWIKRRRLS